jgi:hypothetical protein
MAASVTALLTDITLGESADASYWTGSDGNSAEIYRQGSGSEGWIVGKNANETATFDYYSKATATLDMSGTGVHLYITMRCDIAPFIDYVHFGLYSDTAHGAATTGNKFWTVVDNTTNIEWAGEWLTIKLDVNSTTTFSTSGTLDLSAVDSVAINVDNSNSGNIRSIENTYLDAIRFGTGLKITGTAWDWQDIADDDNLNANKYDIVRKVGPGIFEVNGQLQIGDGATTTTPATSNETLFFKDISTSGIEGGPIGKQASGFYKVIVTGSGCTCDFDNFSIIASANADFIFDADDTGLPDASINWNGGTVIECSSFLSDGAQDFLNIGFYNCGQIDPAGSDFTDCLIDGYTGTDGALLWPGGTTVKDCSFTGNSRAIEHATAVDVTYDGITFTGNTYDIHLDAGATNESIYGSANQDTDVNLDGDPTRVAQTFTTGGTTGELSRARFYLKKTGTLTGNVVAKLYATSGGAPTGAALATSENVLASSIGATYGWEEFEFKDNYTLAATTTYAISVEHTGDGSNYVSVGVDNSSPSHAGTGYHYSGAAWASQTWDVVHELNVDGLLQINATNGANPATYTITGTYLGTVDVENAVNMTITVRNKDTNALIANARVSIHRDSDGLELMNEDTNGSGVATESTNYPGSEFDIYWRVRESPAGGDRYFAESGVGKVTSDGFSTTVLLRPLTIS